MGETEWMIDARALVKRFDDFVAVDRIDVQVEPGSSSASSVRTAPGRPPPCA
jgi:ABC-type branched-subunit amino acid transport system ATPase component